MSRQMNTGVRGEIYIAAEKQYKIARQSILVLVLLTLLNIGLMFLKSETIFLFSIKVPYFAVTIANAGDYRPILISGALVAAILLLMYLLCWWFSKKHYGWMIAAVILFAVDTIALVAFYQYVQLLAEVSAVLDVVFHVIVLAFLALGTKYGARIKKMSEETAVQPDVDSVPLRSADMNVRFRVLLEVEAENHHIVYRRVGRVNELVIDGNVYNEVKMLFEIAHSLEANIDGHLFSVGYDGNSNSFCTVDGRMVAQKRRII